MSTTKRDNKDLAERLQRVRDGLRVALGDNYAATIAPWKLIVLAEADRRRCKPMAAVTHMLRVNSEPQRSTRLIAAVIDIVEGEDQVEFAAHERRAAFRSVP